MTRSADQNGKPHDDPRKVMRLVPPWASIARHLAAGKMRAGDIEAVLDIEARSTTTIPLVMSPASCGFPSPADDYLDRPLDFNELLIQNPAATFAVRIAGTSMIKIGIFPGDIAVVDRSITPVNGSIVLALLRGEFTVKRFRRSAKGITLEAENPEFKDLFIPEEEGSSFEIWGVLTHCIHRL